MSKEYDFGKEFHEAVTSGDGNRERAIIKFVLENGGFASRGASQLALAMTATRRPYIEFLERFVLENSNLMHVCRVFLAEIYAGENKSELASETARTFLKMYASLSQQKNFMPSRELNDYVAHAYMLLTAIYTSIGARTYSGRVLNKALGLEISPEFRHSIENELTNLSSELEDPTVFELNKNWEEFFAEAKHYTELRALAISQGYEVFAVRLELLEAQFRFQAGYRVDEDEMLLEVCEVKIDDKEKPARMLA